MPTRLRFSRICALIIAVGLVVAACSDDDGQTSTDTTAPDDATAAPSEADDVEQVAYDPTLSYVAESLVDGENIVYESPGGAEKLRLPNPTPNGAPLVFLTVGDPYVDPDWIEVYLPARPNGSTGWVQRSSVDLTTHDWRIEVNLSDFGLEVFKGDEVFLESTVAIAGDNTPTPGGLYFTTVLIQPTNEDGQIDPDTVYGTWAYGLSGYSETLETFNGGDGQLGIHGTNQPELLGQKVSHGCIRMHNDDIDQLAPVLPLGVPVEVIA